MESDKSVGNCDNTNWKSQQKSLILVNIVQWMCFWSFLSLSYFIKKKFHHQTKIISLGNTLSSKRNSNGLHSSPRANNFVRIHEFHEFSNILNRMQCETCSTFLFIETLNKTNFIHYISFGYYSSSMNLREAFKSVAHSRFLLFIVNWWYFFIYFNHRMQITCLKREKRLKAHTI